MSSSVQTGLFSGTKFLKVERAVSEKGVTVVVLETCIWESIDGSWMNLERVGNGGRSALAAILYDFVNWLWLLSPVLKKSLMLLRIDWDNFEFPFSTRWILSE